MLDTDTIDTVRPEGLSVVSARWFMRPLFAAMAMAIALMAIGQLIDPGGYLSTDVGGKVATLEAMSSGRTLSPDLGYWAESVDPDGSLYPMYSTANVNGAWVNVTTLPMLYAALPLYALGGVRLALLVPVLATVMAALGARAMALRLSGGERRAMAAFWVVGLASPATIYSLSIWEHSLGLALMTWGVVAAVDVVHRVGAADDRVRSAVIKASLSGLAFGVAATLRQEALVYGFVAGVALMLALAQQRRLAVAAWAGVAMAGSALSALVANGLLELVILGDPMRSGRSVATAEAAGSVLDSLGTRIQEAITTGAGVTTATSLVVNLEALGLLVLFVIIGMRLDGKRDAVPAMVGLTAVLGLRAVGMLIGGLDFIPGLLAATPVAGLALVRGWQPGPRRFVMAVAVAAMPLVWLTQYVGGAGPQWGGRYLLTSGLLLAVVAIVGLESPSAIRAGRTLAAVGFALTVLGLMWSGSRAASFSKASAVLASRDEPVLIFGDPFVARESGPVAVEGRWLAAPDSDTRRLASEAVAKMGHQEFGYVEVVHGSLSTEFDGWSLVTADVIDLVGDDRLRISTWRITD